MDWFTILKKIIERINFYVYIFFYIWNWRAKCERIDGDFYKYCILRAAECKLSGGVSETSSSIVGHTYLYFELRNSLQQNYVKERNARYVRRLSAVSPRGDKAYEIAGSSTNSDSRRAECSFRVRERNTPNSHPLSHLPVIVRSRNRTEKNVSTNESSSLEGARHFSRWIFFSLVPFLDPRVEFAKNLSVEKFLKIHHRWLIKD